MSHPRAEAFWQIPHRRDRQDDKCPTNARGRMSRLGIDWVIKEWNAWRNHGRTTRTTVLIYIFLLLLKFKERHFYDTITSMTVLIHFFVIIEVQGQSFWSWRKLTWRSFIPSSSGIRRGDIQKSTETPFSSRVFDVNSRKTRMDRSFKAF